MGWATNMTFVQKFRKVYNRIIVSIILKIFPDKFK